MCEIPELVRGVTRLAAEEEADPCELVDEWFVGRLFEGRDAGSAVMVVCAGVWLEVVKRTCEDVDEVLEAVGWVDNEEPKVDGVKLNSVLIIPGVVVNIRVSPLATNSIC